MENIKDIIDRHEKIVLMFSGGKDSVACYYLLKEWLPKITVLWVNPGDLFPENEAIVREFAKKMPNFLEVKSDALGFKKLYGTPVDLVVINHTQLAEVSEGARETKVISGYDCCSMNYWFPAQEEIKRLGSTLIIRGQRSDERATSPVRSGEIVDGVEYLFPLQDWTQADVLAYLTECGFSIPEFFHFSESSLDCLHCTAFLHDFTDREEYMKKNHAVAHAENKAKLTRIIANIEKELEFIKGVACD